MIPPLPRLAFVLAAAALAAAAGCGSGRPELAPVSGRVTYGGKPVTSGRIHFWPQEGPKASGRIGEDGTFELTTYEPGDGAVLGKHTVTIEATVVHESGPQPRSMEEEIEMFGDPDAAPLEPARIEHLVPEKYSKRDTSGLEREVTRDGNEFTFDLPAKPGG
jgi:hypothetical protein